VIEKLIDYIQHAGFRVRLEGERFGGILYIRKEDGDWKVTYAWAITRERLNNCPWHIWKREADIHMQKIDKAMVERKPIG
jgi:hypothetical protein